MSSSNNTQVISLLSDEKIIKLILTVIVIKGSHVVLPVANIFM